jgi:hypothetical protein
MIGLDLQEAKLYGHEALDLLAGRRFGTWVRTSRRSAPWCGTTCRSRCCSAGTNCAAGN